MYDWLTGALQGSSQVITASRRLARVLTEEYARGQLDAGKAAWRSPAIFALQDWMARLLSTAELTSALPTRLNTHQSRILWERCLRREISSPLLNTAALVRQSRDTWTNLNAYCVPLDEVDASAQGRDQRIFVTAARSYRSILEREDWIDDAGIASLAVRLLQDGHAELPERLTFAGFDRFTPATKQLHEALSARGAEILEIGLPAPAENAHAAGYENADAEMRVAGAWARQVLLDDPSQRVAIVAPQLERDSERSARLVREGLVPGWQGAGRTHEAAVNVSYGRRLSDYPAISVALLLLRWLHEDVSSQDISMLLRSGACGDDEMAARSQLDLDLRRLPAMSWSPGRFLRAFEQGNSGVAISGWFERMRFLDASRKRLAIRATPSQWAMSVDDFLNKLDWPGPAALDSKEFQLINRWRELLNDFARLELVATTMSLGEMLSRLQTLAGETVFQAESDGAIVQLLGPLEAAGMQFDQLWICGLSSANWPPTGKPSPLVSRQLQRDYAMPDADPADTLAYASRVLQRLAASTRRLYCSYPLTDGDAEQSPTGLLASIADIGPATRGDPGWFATQLVECGSPIVIGDDSAPPVTGEASISGGAGTLQRQLNDPFAAFAYGRLGIRPVQPLVQGLAAHVRGSLIHDALHEMYRERQSWEQEDLERNSRDILDKAFARLEMCADATMRHLLQLERLRVMNLLADVVALDAERNDFEIDGLEVKLELVIDLVRLRLRVDRIDRIGGDGVVIIDYKTGQHRKFIASGGEPDDLQLVTYSMAVNDPVAGLAYVNVDSRRVSLEGAGRELTPDRNWDEDLSRWQQTVSDAARALQDGDIRINGALPVKTSRMFGLLSRIRELQHDA